MALEVGKVLGAYRILTQIGAGGMGEVYKAWDAKLEREVALKVLPAHLGQQAELLERFGQEARAVAALSHPNVLRIFDFGREDDIVFAVMELLEGETLRARLKGGPLPPRRVAEWGAQIARGLAAAHAKGIIHRDLKLENLFLSKDGLMKILDFGLAKRLPEGLGELAAHPETLSGMVLGTVGYMSPEQARGEAVDRRSDLFSLGAVLFEMVTGVGPFTRPTATETLAAILMDDPPDLSREEIPPNLGRVIHHCLEKRVEDRFQTALDVAFALENLSEAPGLRRPPFALPRLPSRKRRGTFLWAGLLLLVGAGVGWCVWGLRPPAQPRFQRLSFRDGPIRNARFTPDAGGVVYSATWGEEPPRIYTSRLDTLEDRALELPNAHLLALTGKGDLALLEKVEGPFGWVYRGILSRATLGGSAPKELMADVEWADWAPSGELAVVRTVDARGRLEYPPGKVRLETPGWFSHPRFSPKGDRLAVIEHPLPGYSRGRVLLLELATEKSVVTSGEMASVEGVAWKGKELWYSGAPQGFDRVLYAQVPGSPPRVVTRVPGSFTIYDIAPDGAVLAGVEESRSGVLFLERGTAQELSLRTWSVFRDLSADGRVVLLDEEMDKPGPDYDLYLRHIGGAAPAMLVGQGTPAALSADGAWVAAILHSPSAHPVIIPAGKGEPRHLDGSGIENFLGPLAFTPGAKGLVFAGQARGSGPRLYYMDASDQAPHAVTPEGFLPYLGEAFLSPKGDLLVARDQKDALLFKVQGSHRPEALKGLQAGERLLHWTPDGKRILVFRSGALPVEVWAIELATGKRSLWMRVAPPGYLGDIMSHTARMSDDGSRLAFTYRRLHTVLYRVEGLR